MTSERTQGADVHTLTGAYVADALSDQERVMFEEHLAACPPCSDEVRELRETTARLAAAEATPPPDRLLHAVMAEIATTRQLPPQTPAEPPAARRTPAMQRWLLAAAAVLAIALAGATVVAVRAYQQLDATRDTADEINSVLAAPDARTATGAAGTAHATVLFSRQRGKLVFLPSDMPALPTDRTYQLWLLADDGAHSAGLLPSTGAGEPVIDAALGDVDALAVTVEPAGGSPRPTAPLLMVIEMA